MINASPKGLLRRPAKVFYGWWIVAISVAIDASKHGTFNRGISFYVLPVSRELGIGVAAFSFADMLGRLAGGLLGPLAGYLTDRFGPRTMLIFGGIASGLGFVLLGFTHSYLYFIVIFVGLLSMGFRSGYNNATVPALNQWFRRRRSLAMSIASTGNGLGGLVLAPLVGLVVLTLGWRIAAMVSGIGIIVVVVPLALFVRRSPENMGLLPDGDAPQYPASSQQGEQVRLGTAEPRLDDSPDVSVRTAQTGWYTDFTAREAMSGVSYWLLVLAVGLRNSVHSGISLLLVPVIVWFLQGAGRTEEASQPIAVFYVGALSFGTLVLNPFVGWMGDKWSKQRLSAVAMLAGSLAMVVILNQSGHLWQLGVFVVLLAVSESANPLAWAIMGDFFGRRSYATLRGWQHLPDQLMSMSTPVWMGWIFDHSDSGFLWALVPLSVLNGLSAICYWTIPRPALPARLRNRQATPDASS